MPGKSKFADYKISGTIDLLPRGPKAFFTFPSLHPSSLFARLFLFKRVTREWNNIHAFKHTKTRTCRAEI